MKKRNSRIGLVMLIAILVLGVGYATVSSVNLIISGTVSTKTEDLDVVISAASPNAAPASPADEEPYAYGTVTSPAGLTATITVDNLDTVGDTGAQTVTYTVTNNEDNLAATLSTTSAVFTKGTEFFEATVAYPDGTTVAPGESVDVTVTVKLKKMPIQESDSSDTLTVTLLATPAQPSA